MEEKVKKIKIAFLGRGELGMNVLKKLLLKQNIQICLIISCKSTPEVKFEESDFKLIAEKNEIPFYKTNQINNDKFYNILMRYNFDIAVAMLWLYTIEKKIIDTAKVGFINCHSGLLPRYRGNACGNWAILNEEKKFGITTHLMKGDELDNGPIILQETVPINQETKIEDLNIKFNKIGAELVIKSIYEIRNKEFKLIPQNDEYASYCYPRIPSDGEINWDHNSKNILKLINASGKPYPGAFTLYKSSKNRGEIKKMIIHDASIENHNLSEFYSETGHLLKLENGEKWGVVCGDKKLLILKLIEIDNIMYHPKDYFKSVRIRFGIKLSDFFDFFQNKLKSYENYSINDFTKSFLNGRNKKLEELEDKLFKTISSCNEKLLEKGIKNEINTLKNLSFQKKYFNWENRLRWFGIQIYQSLKITKNNVEVFAIGLWYFNDENNDLQLRLYISMKNNNSIEQSKYLMEVLNIQNHEVVTQDSSQLGIIKDAYIILKNKNINFGRDVLVDTAITLYKKLANHFKKP